jgi:hypothetical protein
MTGPERTARWARGGGAMVVAERLTRDYPSGETLIHALRDDHRAAAPRPSGGAFRTGHRSVSVRPWWSGQMLM